MWNERLERHAARMRARFEQERKKEAELQEYIRQRQEAGKPIKVSTAGRRIIITPKPPRIKRPYNRLTVPKVLNCTDEQKDVIRFHGLHTSRAAKQLGWSENRVQRYGLALGVFTLADLKARSGKKGRPAGPPKVKEVRPRKNASRYQLTDEITEVLRSGKPITEICEATGWPRSIVYLRMKQLSIKRTTVKYHPDDATDEVMRDYPGQFTKVSIITGWPVWAVERRMDELKLVNPTSRYRDDTEELVRLLEKHQGCIADVQRALKKEGKIRGHDAIMKVRDEHGIKMTKEIIRPSRKNFTPAMDDYIQQLIKMSDRRRNEYLKSAFAALPTTLSRAIIANLTGISRKTIDSYVNKGWITLGKKEFLQFIIDQCDYASMSDLSGKGQAFHASA